MKQSLAHKNDSERNELSKALSKLEIWTKTNGLKISSDKCFALYLGKNNIKESIKSIGKQ